MATRPASAVDGEDKLLLCRSHLQPALRNGVDCSSRNQRCTRESIAAPPTARLPSPFPAIGFRLLLDRGSWRANSRTKLQNAAAPHRRIQINQLQPADSSRTDPTPLLKVVEFQRLAAALHELHNLAAHQVDRRNQHDTSRGNSLRRKFLLEIPGASHPVVKNRRPPVRISTAVADTPENAEPRPRLREAIPEFECGQRPRASNSQSKPEAVPSRFIEVSKILSPHRGSRPPPPRHSIASSGRASAVGIASHPDLSVARSLNGHDYSLRSESKGNLSNQVRIGEDRGVDANLSAPAANTAPRLPGYECHRPTVNGNKQLSRAARRTVSRRVARR